MAVKLVTQETLTDCGLACVAMVSGQSLATVRKVAIKDLGYPKDGPYTTTHENPSESTLRIMPSFSSIIRKTAQVIYTITMPPLVPIGVSPKIS